MGRDKTFKKFMEYSMFLHLKYSAEKVNFLHYYSEVYTLSWHKSMVGRGWEKTVEIIFTNIHKYSHDACANVHDMDMNTNACAHACVNAHTHTCVCGCTHVHACAHNHNTHIVTYIMNKILDRKNSQICLQGHVCVDARVFRDSHHWWDQWWKDNQKNARFWK